MEPNERDPHPPMHPEAAGSSTGLESNVAGALAYILGPITGVLFLVIEKRSRFVRFHAAQSTALFVVFFALGMVSSFVFSMLAVIPILGWVVSVIWLFFSMILGLVGLLLWIFLMYKAFSGEEWEFPWVGQQARRVIFKEQP